MVGIPTATGESDTTNRVMQLFSIKSSTNQSDNYPIIEGDACSFDIFTLEGNTEASTLFAFGRINIETSVGLRGIPDSMNPANRYIRSTCINILDIHKAVCQKEKLKCQRYGEKGGSDKQPFKQEIEWVSTILHNTNQPVEPREFIVSLRISKHGLCFAVTNLGVVSVCDIQTAESI